MLSPILALATLLRDGGISGAMLQRQAMSHAELSALFWISVCWGLGLAALVVDRRIPLLAVLADVHVGRAVRARVAPTDLDADLDVEDLLDRELDLRGSRASVAARTRRSRA